LVTKRLGVNKGTVGFEQMPDTGGRTLSDWMPDGGLKPTPFEGSHQAELFSVREQEYVA
jgi:hypothetical protein